MKKILLLLMLAISLIGCGKKSNEDGESKEVVVGMSADFAPFEYRENDEIKGFDVELLAELSKKTGINFKLNDIAFAGLLPALQTKKIDLIVSGMSVTEERKKAVLFTNSYFKVSQVIIVNKNKKGIASANDLIGKKVGVPLGTTSETAAEKIKGVSLKRFNKGYQAILDLKSDKIDAVILDSQQASNFLKENTDMEIVGEPLAIEEYAMAANKDEQELVGKINKGLEEILQSQFYSDLMKKYIK